MFDQAKSVSEIKIGVTATVISNMFLFVFSNYNSIRARDAKYGQSLPQKR